MAADEREDSEPPPWEPVTEPRFVYRFLQAVTPAPSDFIPDGEREGKKRLGPDEHPDILTGMSVFVSEAKARERWRQVRDAALRKQRERASDRAARLKQVRPRPFRLSIGSYIGEVLLGPGEGFELVDRNEPDGHLTLRGDRTELAARVVRVYPAETEPT